MQITEIMQSISTMLCGRKWQYETTKSEEAVKSISTATMLGYYDLNDFERGI